MTSSSTTPLSKDGQPRFPLGEELKIRCWAALAFCALWFLGKTTRKRFIHSEELFARWQRGEQVILAFWHGRILMMVFGYHGPKACVMNSIHRDGEIVTRVLKRFGTHAVRGSSTRGWTGGLKGMLAAHRQGYDLLVVPDGPLGPPEQAKSGVLQLARATGAPIFPVTYGAARKITIKSWDQLIIPFPFSRLAYVAGAPILVPRDATSEVMEDKRKELEEALISITKIADASFSPPQPTSGSATP